MELVAAVFTYYETLIHVSQALTYVAPEFKQ